MPDASRPTWTCSVTPFSPYELMLIEALGRVDREAEFGTFLELMARIIQERLAPPAPLEQLLRQPFDVFCALFDDVLAAGVAAGLTEQTRREDAAARARVEAMLADA